MSRKDMLLIRLDNISRRIESVRKSVAWQKAFVDGLPDGNDKREAQELLFISTELLRIMCESRDRIFRELDRL